MLAAARALPIFVAATGPLLTALAQSVGNLAVGFAPGAYRVSLSLTALVIGAGSVAMSVIRLESGAWY